MRSLGSGKWLASVEVDAEVMYPRPLSARMASGLSLGVTSRPPDPAICFSLAARSLATEFRFPATLRISLGSDLLSYSSRLGAEINVYGSVSIARRGAV